MPTYPTYKLGEIIDKVPIEFKVKQKEYLSNGKFPVVDQGQDLIGGFVDDESLLVKTELPVIVFGDHTKAKKFIDFPFVAGADGTKIIKPKKDFFIEPKLFYWFLHCVKFPDKGYARHFQYLLKSDIAVPPLPTQHQIVSRIETLFAELDKAVEHLRTAQQQLKTYRQAVLNHWLNNEDGKWETVNIQCFLDKSSKGMITGPFGSALKKSEHQCSGIPVLGIENIGEGSFKMPNKIFVTEEKAKELKGFMVLSEDIIISRSGTVGEICKVPTFMNGALLSTNLIRVRLSLDVISADFFVLLFQCSQIRQQVKNLCKGTTRAFLNQTILNQIEFPLPPLPDQQRIVQEIESHLSQAEAAEARIAESLQKTEALRQSILKKAFSGELV